MEPSRRRIDPSTPLAELTYSDLLAILRGEVVFGEREASKTQEEAAIENRRLADNREHQQQWNQIQEVARMVGTSPPALQVCFLRSLAALPDEAKKFVAAPAEYAREHGILLDPSLVRSITDTVLFGDEISAPLASRLGPGAVRDVIDLRTGGTNAWPAAVAAIAAVVGAAAQVVKAVTAVTKDRVSDFIASKGIGLRGVRLPGGAPLKPNQLTVVVSGPVAMYGATTVAAALVAQVVSGKSAGAMGLPGGPLRGG